VQFDGVVASTCSIAIGTPGVLDVSNNGTRLSTTSGLGAPAHATITSTGTTFKVSVGTPSAFTLAPSGGNAGTTFDSRYSTSGVTIVVDAPGSTLTPLGLGITNLSVNLIANHPTLFPSGIYSAQSVVTCE